MTEPTLEPLRRSALRAWPVALSLLILGPALGRGYVLSYDMVWVPDLALRRDFFGLGTGLPRAVPSDAVIAVVDQLVPGMILQKLVLLAALVLAGVGAQRLVPEGLPHPTSARLIASTLYLWNPFVAERLWIGHWPVLLCYAVLPWLVSRPRTRAWWLLLPLGSLSAATGVLTAIAAYAARARDGRRVLAVLTVMLAGVNAPWIVAGLLHAGDSASGGTAAFAMHGEGPLPALMTGLRLGGIWNAEVVPASQIGWRGVVALLLVLVGAALSARAWWSRTRTTTGPVLLVLWLIGFAIAALGPIFPVGSAWLAQHVPGGGIFRDGARALALCAPLLVSVLATGAACLLAHVSERVARRSLSLAALLLPVLLMPDLAWGIGGALRPVEFPSSYAPARAALAGAASEQPEGERGDLLVLPFSSYRAPSWNAHRKVLDPLPRFLTPDYLVNDQLSIDRRVIAGEDPRVPEVLDALARPRAQDRAIALGRLGVRFVVTEADAGPAPAVAGSPVYTGSALTITRLKVPVTPRNPSPAARTAVALSWVAWLLGTLAAASRVTNGRRRRHKS